MFGWISFLSPFLLTDTLLRFYKYVEANFVNINNDPTIFFHGDIFQNNIPKKVTYHRKYLSQNYLQWTHHVVIRIVGDM